MLLLRWDWRRRFEFPPLGVLSKRVFAPKASRAKPPFETPAKIVVSLVVLLIIGLNIVTRLQGRPGNGQAPINIVFDEATSAIAGIAMLMAFWPLWKAIDRQDFSALQLPAVLLPTGLIGGSMHIIGFHLLRMAFGPMIGQSYTCPVFQDFGFELAKDMAFNGLLFAGLFFVPTWRAEIFRPRTTPLASAPAPTAPPTSSSISPPTGRELVDLPMGRNRLRVRASEIAAVASAGNYAEFRLVDGRRPMVRTTLGSLEAQLCDHGLLRVHRSWIVNPVQVRRIRSLPSGDHRLTLVTGETIPASRRYGCAMDRVFSVSEALGQV